MWCYKLFLYSLFVNIIVPVINSSELIRYPKLEGYYWRDYDGDVPDDAFPAGTNANGIITFIGQVLHEKQLIPAKIDPEVKKVTYEWGSQEFVAYINVKIFCTQHPEQFEWVKTSTRHINSITNKRFVSGGYEASATLYIGRKQFDEELVVGKIVFTNTETTINTTKDGRGTHHHQDFEVLAYNPYSNSTKNDTCPCKSTTNIYYYNS